MSKRPAKLTLKLFRAVRGDKYDARVESALQKLVGPSHPLDHSRRASFVVSTSKGKARLKMELHEDGPSFNMSPADWIAAVQALVSVIGLWVSLRSALPPDVPPSTELKQQQEHKFVFEYGDCRFESKTKPTVRKLQKLVSLMQELNP